jgi:hypothetical protein
LVQVPEFLDVVSRISANHNMHGSLSVMALVIRQHEYLNVAARSHGIILLKHAKRPVKELVFFNRLWDVYERYIAEKNTRREEYDSKYDEWRLLVDQIVSPTDKEMDDFAFGDFLDPFLDDCQSEECQSGVCCFADEVVWDDSMMTIRSRTKGLQLCEMYPEDWSSQFHAAWDRYLLALVEKRQDIWKHNKTLGLTSKRTGEQQESTENTYKRSKQ